MEHFFLQGSAGRLYCVYHAAPTPLPGRPALLHLPAFAEEMNKARRMVAVASRKLAAHGVSVLCLDPLGTGDSEGDFGAAGWAQWLADADSAIAELRARGHERLGVWGLRLGCLLAAEIASDASSAIDALLLWQPVLSGEQFLNQFLRLRVAGDRLRGEGGESVKDLRAAIKAGTSVEVAGYEMGSALCEPLATRSLGALVPPVKTMVHWYEVNTDGAAPGMAAARTIDSWQGAGVSVTAAGVAGEPFWNTQEISAAPALIERTGLSASGLFVA